MPGTGRKSPLDRAPLSRERVLAGAVAVADSGGIAGLTIRSLAEELGVKPMSVYHHVANKERDPRRHRRHRLQPDRAAVSQR